MSLKEIAPAALVLSLLSSTPSIAVQGSLCTKGEAPLFSCPIGVKVVSVCGVSATGATYRYGRPGRIELERRGGLHYANQGFSGGGEDQLWFDNASTRYILYSRTVRTSFSSSGRHDPEFSAGLVALTHGRKLFNHGCGGRGDQGFDAKTAAHVPTGEFVDH